MPGPDQMKAAFANEAPLPDFMNRLKPFGAPAPDYADLERRVADLEERAMRQDKEAAARARLKEMGFILPTVAG